MIGLFWTYMFALFCVSMPLLILYSKVQSDKSRAKSASKPKIKLRKVVTKYYESEDKE